MTEQRHLIARNDDMLRRYKAGQTYRQIADHYRISTERVRVIVRRRSIIEQFRDKRRYEDGYNAWVA